MENKTTQKCIVISKAWLTQISKTKSKNQYQQSYVNIICKSIRVTISRFAMQEANGVSKESTCADN